MGIVFDGKAEEFEGIHALDFLAHPKLAILTPEDGRLRRTHWVRGIVLHTTKGIPGGRNQTPQRLLAGFGPRTNVGERSATYCRTNPDKLTRGANHGGVSGGHHLTVDADGEVSCHMDLVKVAAYHGNTVNEVTVGIEVFQSRDAELWSGQIDAVVRLCDVLTRRLRIQRQFHWPYRGPLARMDAHHGGEDVVGLYGHRDVTSARGAGDPGDFVFEALRAAGYEPFDFAAGEDLRVWRDRQTALGLPSRASDGVPGPITCGVLERTGYKHGLWVSRPGD